MKYLWNTEAEESHHEHGKWAMLLLQRQITISHFVMLPDHILILKNPRALIKF